MSAVSNYKINWTSASSDLPETVDIQLTDAKTQRVFADLIEEQECDNLPFVLAYHPSFNFMDARSLDPSSYSKAPGDAGPSTPIRFLALLPGENEFYYLGSNTETESKKEKFITLFLKTLSLSDDVVADLNLIYFRYQFGNGVHEDSERAKKIMSMKSFHSKALKVRKTNEEQIDEVSGLFKEARDFFRDLSQHRKLFSIFSELASRFYKPVYFPLFLCFHYGVGTRKNTQSGAIWLQNALKFGDPRAIAWNEAKEFLFMDMNSDFQLCFDMHARAEESIQNYVPIPESFKPQRENENS